MLTTEVTNTHLFALKLGTSEANNAVSILTSKFEQF